MHTALVLKLMRDRSLWELTTAENSARESAAPVHAAFEFTQAGTD
jgi:hypothetical protein